MSRADNNAIWARFDQYRAMHSAWHVGLDREDISLIKDMNTAFNESYLRGEAAGKKLSEAKTSEPILTTDEPDGYTGVHFVSWGGGKTPYTTYTGLSLNLPDPVNTEAPNTQDYYLARAAVRNAILRFQEYKTVDPSIFFEKLKYSKNLYRVTGDFELLISGMIQKAQEPLREENAKLKSELDNLKAESRVIHQKMINDAAQAVAETLSKKYGQSGFHTGGYISGVPHGLKDTEIAAILKRPDEHDQKWEKEKALIADIQARIKTH